MNTLNLNRTRKGGCLFSIFKLLLLLIVIGVVAFYFFLGTIVNLGLHFVLKGTGVNADVGSLSVSISKQEVDVKNFYITNPPGYTEGNAISFTQAYVKTDLNPIHVISEKLITVDEVKIVGLNAMVELSTKSGVSALFSAPNSNLTDLVNAIIPKKDASAPAPTDTKATESTASAPFKIIVKKIVFADGKTLCGINNEIVTVNLPSFTLENLGVEENGLTPSQLATEILGQLASKATIDAAKEMTKRGIKIGDKTLNQGAKETSEGLKSVGDALKSLF